MSHDWIEPDPEFWKKLGYNEKSWHRHYENVSALRKRLIMKFPQLENSMKYGLGATTDAWLKVPPEEKGEPDITIYDKYKALCSIEVSGSDRVRMPNTIWIRPDKLKSAMGKAYPTWFWMVYPNEIRLVSMKTVKKHESDVITVHIKRDPQTGRKVPEKYIEIPYDESEEEERLFEWLEDNLSSADET